ncbi:MAG: hypothetical protein FWE14_07005 [Lachnospiraceae bacterium]|nr:hypothetical protein [Lachnospiraceae bacterium]
MKIQNSNTIVQYNRNESGDFKPNLDIPNESIMITPAAFNEIQDEITISEEGFDCYREKINAMGNQAVKPKKPFIPANLYEGSVENEIHNQLIMKQKEFHIGTSAKARAETLILAYASLYDEIMRGYEDGTRENFIRIGSEGRREDFRLVTKEEELAALDKAASIEIDFIIKNADIEERFANMRLHGEIEAHKGLVWAQGNNGIHSGTLSEKEFIGEKEIHNFLMNAFSEIRNNYSAFKGDFNGLIDYILGRINK